MDDKGSRASGIWSALLVGGVAGLCCGGSVLLPVGGMAVLAGWLGAWGWLVAGGVVLCGLGLVLYHLRSRKRVASGESV